MPTKYLFTGQGNLPAPSQPFSQPSQPPLVDQVVIVAGLPREYAHRTLMVSPHGIQQLSATSVVSRAGPESNLYLSESFSPAL